MQGKHAFVRDVTPIESFPAGRETDIYSIYRYVDIAEKRNNP